MGQLEEEEEEEFSLPGTTVIGGNEKIRWKNTIRSTGGPPGRIPPGGRRFERFEYGDNAISEGNVV